MAKAFIQDNEGVITDLTKAIENNPGNAVAFDNRGLAKEALKDFLGRARIYLRDYRGAIADYNKAIKLNPEYSLAYFSLRTCKIWFGTV